MGMSYKSPLETLAKCRRDKYGIRFVNKNTSKGGKMDETLQANSLMGWLNRRESDKETERRKFE